MLWEKQANNENYIVQINFTLEEKCLLNAILLVVRTAILDF